MPLQIGRVRRPQKHDRRGRAGPNPGKGQERDGQDQEGERPNRREPPTRENRRASEQDPAPPCRDHDLTGLGQQSEAKHGDPRLATRDQVDRPVLIEHSRGQGKVECRAEKRQPEIGPNSQRHFSVYEKDVDISAGGRTNSGPTTLVLLHTSYPPEPCSGSGIPASDLPPPRGGFRLAEIESHAKRGDDGLLQPINQHDIHGNRISLSRQPKE